MQPSVTEHLIDSLIDASTEAASAQQYGDAIDIFRAWRALVTARTALLDHINRERMKVHLD